QSLDESCGGTVMQATKRNKLGMSLLDLDLPPPVAWLNDELQRLFPSPLPDTPPDTPLVNSFGSSESSHASQSIYSINSTSSSIKYHNFEQEINSSATSSSPVLNYSSNDQ
ncbi:unnamed protein product, partial [Meganyctiphanes norvegica]